MSSSRRVLNEEEKKILQQKWKEIWNFVPEEKWQGRYKQGIEETLFIPAEGKVRNLIYYGVYCGPASKNDRPPIDALDFACELHDTTFRKGKKSDISLIQSAKLLQEYQLIQSPSTLAYSTRMQSPMFIALCESYRYVYLFLALVACFLVLIIVIIFMVVVLMNYSKNRNFLFGQQ